MTAKEIKSFVIGHYHITVITSNKEIGSWLNQNTPYVFIREFDEVKDFIRCFGGIAGYMDFTFESDVHLLRFLRECFGDFALTKAFKDELIKHKGKLSQVVGV